MIQPIVPTTDPFTKGALWQDPNSGLLRISKGPSTVDLSFKVGLNICGGEHNKWASEDECARYAAKGFKRVRMTDIWTNFQTAPLGDLNQTHMDRVIQQLKLYDSYGFSVLFEPCHQYGRFVYPDQSTVVFGDPNLPNTALGDFWVKVITALQKGGVTNIWAYDLHNEMHDLYYGADVITYDATTQTWIPDDNTKKNMQVCFDINQTTINMIRTVDNVTPIAVGGYHWQTAGSWEAYSIPLMSLVDPSGLKLIYEAHCYYDRDSSGTKYDSYPEMVVGDILQPPTYDADGNIVMIVDPATGNLVQKGAAVNPETIGPNRLAGFVKVMKEYNAIGIIGETGVGEYNWYGHDNAGDQWDTILKTSCEYMQANDISFFYFCAGPEYGSYKYGVEIQADGSDTRQVARLCTFTGAKDAPFIITLTVPIRTAPGYAQYVEIDVNGIITENITIELSDGGAGGTFETPTVVVPPGINFYTKVKYTPTTKETVAYITCTNDKGLTNPGATANPISTFIDPFVSLGRTPQHIFWDNKVYLPYEGPLVDIYNPTTTTSTPVYATSEAVKAPLDIAAAKTASGGTLTNVVSKWYDQSLNGRDAGTVPSGYSNNNGPNGSVKPITSADYPSLDDSGETVNGITHYPLEFNQNRLASSSIIDGQSSYTLVVLAKAAPTNGSMDSCVTWMMSENILPFNGNALNVAQSKYGSYLFNYPLAPKSGVSFNMSNGVDGSQYHVYTMRYIGGYGWSTFVDGVKVADQLTNTRNISSVFNPAMCIGFGIWKGTDIFAGEFRGLVDFSAGLTDGEIANFSTKLLSHDGIIDTNPFTVANALAQTITVPLSVTLVATALDTTQPVTTDIISGYTAANIKYVTLAFPMETMISALGGALNTTAVTNLVTAIGVLQSAGVSVTLSPALNYGAFFDSTQSRLALGSTQFPISDLVDYWTKIMSALSTNKITGISGYSIMSQPHDLSVSGTGTQDSVWVDACSQVIPVIRAKDTAAKIYVDGTNWGREGNWATNNPTLHTLSDPNHNLVFNAFCYPDVAELGIYRYWSDVTTDGGSTSLLSERISDFASWLSTHTLKGAIATSVGIYDNETNTSTVGWSTALYQALLDAQAASLEFNLWADDLIATTVVDETSPRNPNSQTLLVASLMTDDPITVDTYDISFTDGTDTFANDGTTGAKVISFSIPGTITKTIGFTFKVTGDAAKAYCSVGTLYVDPSVDYVDTFVVVVPANTAGGAKITLTVTNDGGLTDPAPLVFTCNTLAAPPLPWNWDGVTTNGTGNDVSTDPHNPIIYAMSPPNSDIWTASFNVYVGTDMSSLVLVENVANKCNITTGVATTPITVPIPDSLQTTSSITIAVAPVGSRGAEGTPFYVTMDPTATPASDSTTDSTTTGS